MLRIAALTSSTSLIDSTAPTGSTDSTGLTGSAGLVSSIRPPELISLILYPIQLALRTGASASPAALIGPTSCSLIQ